MGVLGAFSVPHQHERLHVRLKSVSSTFLSKNRANSKIADFPVEIRIEQDIFAFHVAMYCALFEDILSN